MIERYSSKNSKCMLPAGTKVLSSFRKYRELMLVSSKLIDRSILQAWCVVNLKLKFVWDWNFSKLVLIFSNLRNRPLHFRTAEYRSNFRKNTDKYGHLATLPKRRATESSLRPRVYAKRTFIRNKLNLSALSLWCHLFFKLAPMHISPGQHRNACTHRSSQSKHAL